MVDTINLEELERKMEENDDFALVDVLSKDHFEQEHIPGAVNIPLDEIGERALQEFDRSDEIVVYCASESCQASPKAARKLESLGFENVKDFEAGLKGWKDAGNSVEG